MSCSFSVWCSNNGAKYFMVILWLAINVLLFWNTYVYYQTAPEFFYLHEMLGAGLCVSRGTANVINLNLGVLVLPVCRSLVAFLRNPWLQLSPRTFRILLDSCKGFHIFCAILLTGASFVHFFGHSYNALNYSIYYNSRFKEVNAASYPDQNPLFIIATSVPGITGFCLMVVLSMIVSAAFYHVRFASYDIFWYSHRLFVVFYLLVLVHGIRGILKAQKNVMTHTPGCLYLNSSEDVWAEPEPEVNIPRHTWKCMEEPKFHNIGSSSWMWICGPLVIYTCDALWRCFRRTHTPVSVLNVIARADDIVEIQMMKEGFTCRPGQFILIQCPLISTFEWHPYTVTKCPTKSSQDFTVYVKVSGDWSESLRDCLLGYVDNSNSSRLLPLEGTNHRLYIDGPFGSPLEDVLRYRICLCIAGGVGITPFIAILQHLRLVNVVRLKRLYLVWVCRDPRSVTIFADTFCDIFNRFWQRNHPDGFDLQLFVTSRDIHSVDEQIPYAHTYLRKRISIGRPLWRDLFYKVSSSHQRTTVGVFCCGPKSFAQNVEQCCNEIYGFRTTFHYYHESF